LAILFTVLTFCNTFAQPAKKQSLLFLGNKNIAPVVYLSDGTPSGVAVDIVRALARHLPQPIDIKVMDWSEAQLLVARGEADALIQINPTAERKLLYDFSDPLLESHFSIFTTTDKLGISGLKALRGLRVGVEAGGLPGQLLEKEPHIPLTIIPNFLEGFKLLQQGAIDAVVVDYRVGSYVLAEHKFRDIKVTGKPVAFSYSSIAVKKGNTQLLDSINNALRIIKTDGTYQDVLDAWKPKEVVFQTREQITQKMYIVTVTVFLILFAIAAIWTMTLRRALTKRKAAEERLREQYSTLHSIINSVNALIFSVDRQYRYTSFNQGHAAAMQALYGAEIKQGHGILEYMTVPEDRESAKHNIDRALAGEQLVEEAYSGEGLRLRHYFRVSHSPIWRGEEVIGVAMLAYDMTERKQTEEGLAERAMLAELSADIGYSLTMPSDLHSILAKCAEALVRHLEVACAGIWTLDADGNTLELQVEAGAETGMGGSQRRVPVGQLPIGMIVREGKPYVSNALPEEPRLPDLEWALREGMVALAGHPLIVEGMPVGVMAIFSRRRLREVTLKALAPIANGIAIGIKQKLAEKELKELNEKLEQRVQQRTAELEGKNAELQQMNRLFVGRELRMVELKEKIKELLKASEDV